MTNVKFASDRVERAVQDGAQAQSPGTACQLGYVALRLIAIQGSPVAVPGLGAGCGACSDIQIVDDGHVSPSNCAGTTPTVTGSSYTTR